MGAVAAVTGVVGLAGWRWPALRARHGAVAVAAAALVAGLVHAHHFVELPRAVAGLLLVAPLGALAAPASAAARASSPPSASPSSSPAPPPRSPSPASRPRPPPTRRTAAARPMTAGYYPY
ncbi:MAG: hypothetical protein H6703_03820 [Myxococcales bacterium]|nr:hypothetical protein [Myxococcales bacterium]